MSEELKFPVLDGILTEFLEKGARIEKQDGQWHLFSADGEGIACGDTISAMVCNLILREG